MDSDLWLLPIFLQVILIILNGIFACAEIAVISMNDTKLAQLVTDGNKKAVKLQKLTRIPTRFLATIQVAITLSGFLGSAFAADHFAARLAGAFNAAGVRMPQGVAVIIITVILSFITLVFGELVPKRLAMRNSEKYALRLAGLLYAVSKVFTPLVWLLTVVSNAVLRLFGVSPEQKDAPVTEEEIKMMIDAGTEDGTIQTQEKEMIKNVFEFNDISVDEVCTRRTDITVLWLEDTVEEWEEIIHRTRHSFYPLCEETVDNIRGILDAKDFFRLMDEGKEAILKNAVRPAFFVPETLKADQLFRQMRKVRCYFAVVLDEYGGMNGIITLRDLIEQLVGDINDEDDEEEPEDIVKVAENLWHIQGSAMLDDVEEELDIRLPAEDTDTFGGYIFGVLKAIPDDGTSFEMDSDGLHIKVVKVEDHRIVKTIVSKTIEETDEEN